MIPSVLSGRLIFVFHLFSSKAARDNATKKTSPTLEDIKLKHAVLTKLVALKSYCEFHLNQQNIEESGE